MCVVTLTADYQRLIAINGETCQAPVRVPSTEPGTKPDTRSPIERFRKPPKKPLSVTDLVSPAWCEQQYEYSLSKYGRVRQTPAMKQGSSVHKVLEEEVHGVEVPIRVETREDRFGLRIWNVIQSLRVLRETGLTRELEVFGVLEDEVVIGVIDEISTTCPDEPMAARMLASGKESSNKRKEPQLDPNQKTLTEFLVGSQNGSVLESNPAFLGTLHERPPAYYITDIKTRQSKTLPAAGSQSRPTHMQLMIYHRLLSALASNEVPASKVFERYRLDADAVFSDQFIAEIGSIDQAAQAAVNVDGDLSPRTTQREDALTELLDNNTVASLWSLMTTQYALTFSHTTISPLLTAEFRTASKRASTETDSEVAAGTLLGRRSFVYNNGRVEEYVKDEMRWWKGERETKGVEIEEAYKCRICEFADGCTWRATKVEEGLAKARLRSESRRKSEI